MKTYIYIFFYSIVKTRNSQGNVENVKHFFLISIYFYGLFLNEIQASIIKVFVYISRLNGALHYIENWIL